MKIIVNVPTYKRAGMIETFDLLPKANYWVHEFEVDNYRQAHKGIRIKVLPDGLRGNVASVRNHILNQTGNADVSVQVDDDVNYIGYWENKQELRLDGEKDILDMIKVYSVMAKELGVFLWGMNVNADKQVYREYTPF